MRVSVGGFTNYQLSEDGRMILLSLSGKLYVYERDKDSVRELTTTKGTLLDPKFSPDGAKVAYVLDHDVYVYDLATNKESPVTHGGTEKVTHGLAEFVAQEEMDRYSGYWWSPDSKSIAYQQSDAGKVETWYVADPAKPTILAATYAVVLFSIIVQGSTLGFVAKRTVGGGARKNE